MKLLFEMNLSPRWFDLLTRSQIEAVHWSTVSSPHAFEEEILASAAKHDYVVLTNNLDFGAIPAVTHGSPATNRRNHCDYR